MTTTVHRPGTASDSGTVVHHAPGPAPRYRVDIPGATPADLRIVKWHLYLSLTGLLLGALMGGLQALERLDVNLYDEVGLQSYYQGLTLHGVGLAFVFTFSFANAFLTLTTARGLGRPLAPRWLPTTSLVLAWGGLALAGWAILANKATVLFTFYAPLPAAPAFYIGAVLLVVSTWLTLAAQLLTLRSWRRDGNRGERIPLLAHASIVTNIMWFLASLGVAAEVLGILLPWSLGLTDTVDPQFTRILFWFSGHPIVYFWLLPVYVSWYLMLPRMVGGSIWSDGLTRIVFLSFLVLLPVGVHHQFTDPGIAATSKTIQWALTFMIFFPSMITAFSVIAAIEQGGRRRGGRGLFGWLRRLPWGEPAVAGQLLAGLVFMLGGSSGFVNASHTVNLEVHNTAFIPGHFHLTVGTGVALSVMAISYWLVPYLTGHALRFRRLALAQVWLWTIGVLAFSRGQMMAGLDGMPRRTLTSAAPYAADHPSWELANTLTGVGGSLMFLSALSFFVVVVATVHNRRLVGAETLEIPLTDIRHGADPSWGILDRLGIWAAIAVVLSILVYGETIAHYLPLQSVAKAVKVW